MTKVLKRLGSISHLPLTESVLSSGLKLYTLNIKDSIRVYADMMFNVGAKYEDSRNFGISHFLEHMVFKGSSKYHPGDIDKLSTQEGGYNNAGTHTEFTHYYFVLPKRSLALALDMLFEMCTRPSIDTDEFNREREVVKEEIKQYRDNPQANTYLSHQLSFYEDTPWGHNVLGTEKSLESMTPKMMRDYHGFYYEPSNASLVVVGALPDLPKLTERLESQFSNWKQQTTKPPCRFVSKGFKKGQSISFKASDVEATYGHLSIPCCSPDLDKQNAIQSIFLHIMSGTFNSRLNQALIENDQFCTSFGLDEESTSPHNGLIFSFTTDEPKKVDKIIETYRNTLHNIAQNPPSSSELTNAKAVIRSAQAFASENTVASGNWLSDATFFRRSIDEVEKFIVFQKSVEPEDISEYAKTLLGKINRAALTVTHPKGTKIKIPSRDLISYFSFDRSTSFAKSKSKEEPRLLGKLDNGIEVFGWYVPNTEVLSLKALCVYNILGEPIPGISNITAKVMLKGTSRKSASEISTVLENIGGSASGAFGLTHFGIDVNLLYTDRKVGLALIPEILAQASFEEKEIDKAIWDAASKLAKMKDNNSAVALNRFCKEFMQDSPLQVQPLGNEKSLKRIRRSKIVEYFYSLISPQFLKLVVAGDFNDREILENLSREFSKYNFGNKPRDVSIGGSFVGNKKRIEIAMSKEQTAIVLGIPASGFSHEDTVYWSLFNVVLGRSPNSRLFTRLRDQQALAYSVSSTYGAQLNMGYIAVMMLTSTDKCQTAWEGVFREIDDLLSKKLSKSEFNASKRFLVEQVKSSLETTTGKAGDLARNLIAGLPADDTARKISSIASIKYCGFLDFLSRTSIKDWGGVTVGKKS